MNWDGVVLDPPIVLHHYISPLSVKLVRQALHVSWIAWLAG